MVRPPDPARPQRPDPKRSDLKRRLAAILDAHANASQPGDFVIRMDAPLPGPEVLAQLNESQRAAVAAAVAAQPDAARRVRTDPSFAAQLVADPRTALTELGVPAGHGPAPEVTATREATRATRFQGAAQVAPGDLGHGQPGRGQPAAAPPAVTQVLLGATIRTAVASPATWAAFVADPDPVVRTVAETVAWDKYGVTGDSPAAASVTLGVIANYRRALGLPVAQSGNSGATTPGGRPPVTRAPLVDLDQAVAGARDVVIPKAVR